MTVGLLLVLLSSCVDTPEPVRWPVINIVNAESEGNTVLLSAQIVAEADLVSKCGFMFGDDKDNLEKHPSVLNENAFSAVILNVEYDKEYFYSAYAGNGRNEICTDVYSIRIHPLQLPETPEDSTPPDNPTNPGDQTPSEDVTPPDDPTIPEDQIPSEDTDTHGGIDYEIMELKVSYLESYMTFYNVCWAVEPSIKWVEARFAWSENVTDKPKTGLKDFYIIEGQKYKVTYIQYSRHDIIEFEDPVVKEICVRLADTDLDGELSFEEAALLPKMEWKDFAGMNITSFDEFQYFASISNYDATSPYLFDGSSLRNITLCDKPRGPQGHVARLGKGMFKDCRNLETILIGIHEVFEETFMNCTSLKKAHARIIGERAYMGCTALETAGQLNYDMVPAQAFKGCSSLKTFVFENSNYSELTSGIPSGIIDDEAFYGCSSLMEFIVPDTITSIGDKAFYGCSSLMRIFFSSKTPPALGTDVFQGVNPDLKILVPTSLVDTYKSSWPSLADNIFAQE